MEVEAKLTIPHLRVLEVLYQCGGVLSRGKIARRVEKAETYVGRVIGYSDADKRAKFRQTPLGKSVGVPLLDRGYVEEIVLDIDGVSELCIEITEEGKQAYQDQKDVLKAYLVSKASKQAKELDEDESDYREEGTCDSYSDECEADPVE